MRLISVVSHRPDMAFNFYGPVPQKVWSPAGKLKAA